MTRAGSSSSSSSSSRRAACVALSLVVVACGPMRRPDDPTAQSDQEREYHRQSSHGGDGGAPGARRFGEFVVGGTLAGDRPGVRAIVPDRDASAIAVSADAGVASAETAWLVAHIADPADPVHPTDTANVRALAERGADGIRAIAPVLRRGDAPRVPYARRVIERVAGRACRRAGGRDAVVRLVPWLELGRVPSAAVNDAGVVVWTRDDAALWPSEAVARLLAWADAGLPCNPAADAGGLHDGLDGGAAASLPAGDAAAPSSHATLFDAGTTDR